MAHNILTTEKVAKFPRPLMNEQQFNNKFSVLEQLTSGYTNLTFTKLNTYLETDD